MNIFNEVVKGASRQFGREFGRAGANEILKGKNAYYIKSESDYSGRIKPSDNELVRAIKEVAKVKFVTSNKANVSRLVEMTNILLPVIAFKGDETLDQLNDILKLTGGYNDKVEYGLTLIDDNYQDKSLDYFNSKRTELEDKFEKLNVNMKEHILHNLNIAKNSKKSKEKAAGLSLFFGTLGVQWFYLGKTQNAVLSILFLWTLIPTLIGIIDFFIFNSMKDAEFDTKYNPIFMYYSQFNFSD